MAQDISYGAHSIAGDVETLTLPSGVETTMVVITNPHYTQQSQLTAYLKYVLGGATDIETRFYFNAVNSNNDPAVTPDWYEYSIQDLSAFNLKDFPAILDGSTPLSVIYSVAIPANYGIKVTGKAIGGAATMTRCRILTRNN